MLDGIVDLNDSNRFIRNKVFKDGQNGIVAGDNSNLIDFNTISNNTLAGIQIDGNDNAIRSNCLNINSPDIIDDGGGGSVFDDNNYTTSDPLERCEINDEVIVNEGELIQDAVDAVTTTEGFTIRVADRVFKEKINIPANKNRIRIVGAGIGKTIIDGMDEPDGSNGITISGSSLITIENLTAG